MIVKKIWMDMDMFSADAAKIVDQLKSFLL